MTSRPIPKKNPNDIELGFGLDQYMSIGMAGMFGLLPVTSWLVPVIAFLGSGIETRVGDVEGAVLGGLSALSIIVAPWLIPCLILRARQPKGARIAWDSHEIVEWNGPWKRTAIRWENAEGAHLVWNEPTRSASRARRAIQVFDRTSEAVITAWEEEPEEAPLVRRRLVGGKLHLLESTIRERCGLAKPIVLMRAQDPLRPVQRRRVRNFTRLGYVAGFFAPLFAGVNPLVTFPLAVLGSLLLAWRATPVFRELLGVTALFRPEQDPNERDAHRYRLRAVLAEAIVRGAFVVLPIVSSIASWRIDLR